MRYALVLGCLVACGPKHSSAPPQPEPVDAAPTAELPRMALLARPSGAWLPLACPGAVDGVTGGGDCLELDAKDLVIGGVVDGCTDARGPVRSFHTVAEDAEPPAALTLAGTQVVAVSTAPTDPRDKREHSIDLDGDGTAEIITLVPHDNRASYGRSLLLVDGHDPLMTDAFDPFPDAADLQLLGTSDVDGDGRRELILYAPDETGFGIAVQEYWATAEAYRLDCRNP